MNVRFVAVLTLVGLVSACGAATRLPKIDQELAKKEAAIQRRMAYEEWESMRSRLERLGWPIMRDNVELCEKKAKRIGIRVAAQTTRLFASKSEKDFNEALKQVYGIGEYAVIAQVLEGSPAEKAGLKIGDEITGVNGKVSSTGGRAKKWVKDEFFKRMHKDEEFTMSIRRDAMEMDVSPDRVEVCNYPIEMERKDDVNAYADSKKIVFSTGMVRFAREDNHLALVIGHELAHNTMDHIPKSLGNQVAGAVAGALVSLILGVDVTNIGANIGGSVNSQEFEAEADYVGIYYAKRAGYDVTNIATLWRKMAANHPTSIHLKGSTHPSSAKRFLALEQSRDEINRKIARGEPLVPNLENKK